MPVTINNGYMMRAWYDIKEQDLVRSEDEAGVRASQSKIEAIIAQERARGVPSERIVLAGFSQGCAMTLHIGLRHPEPLAGLLCLSGYVPVNRTLAQEQHAANAATPIFLAHGKYDGVIPIVRAVQSRDLLKALGYKIEWHEYSMEHSVSEDEIDDIATWLRRILTTPSSFAGHPSRGGE